MQILHIDLKPAGKDDIELRFFVDNHLKPEFRRLPSSQISELIKKAEEGYYTYFPEDYRKIGSQLYNWLDSSDRFLQKFLDENQYEEILVLAISTSEKLAHLPWEILHDGEEFLLEKDIIPVRWCRGGKKLLSQKNEPENRSLQLLFMATSPTDIETVFEFEEEEKHIQEATAKQPLTLTVEESGCLEELDNLVKNYGKGYFDIFHLTGHGTFKDGEPRFITETETGYARYASAKDILKTLKPQLPKLIFLSGCHTGKAAKKGIIPSLAESLLKGKAKAVLSWGNSVTDRDATIAAATLYESLAAGETVTEAIAKTYQTLIEIKARDWHLLRLYVAESLPGALVTPQNTSGRRKALLPKVTTYAFDRAGKKIVPTYENFIGRRRQLQNCIKNLKYSEAVGVLIYGMGGLGKTSIAARLCDRLNNFKSLVWVGEIDEAKLVGLIADELDSKELRERLQKPDEDLKHRLKQVLESQQKQFLFVLDDFEANLEPRSQTYILKTEARIILKAIVWAIAETNSNPQTNSDSRIIITSRYEFESDLLNYFAKQPLDGFKGADLEKKCNRLAAFSIDSEVDETIQSQAIRLADGNPLLLERLDKIVRDKILDRQKILDRLEKIPVKLREQVLADSLLQQIDDSMRGLLSRGLVFDLPVPREAIKTVCESISGVDEKIDRAIALGLLEVSPDESLRVPRILEIQLPEDKDALYKQAAEILYRLWWTETKIKIIAKGLEIYRLARLSKAEDIVVNIGNLIANGWVNTGHYQSALRICQNTLEVGEDYLLLNTIARAEKVLGLLDEAIEHFEKALELCPDEDIEEQARILNNMADTLIKKGDLDRGLLLYRQCLEICRSIKNIEQVAVIVHNVAIVINQYVSTEIAQTIWDLISNLFLKRDDFPVRVKARIFFSMAVSHQQATLEERLDLLYRSLEIYDRLGEIETKAEVISAIGTLKLLQGDKKSALHLYQSSLEHYKQIQNLRGKSFTLIKIAILIAHNGEVEQALQLIEQALKDSLIVKDYPNIFLILVTLYSCSKNKVYLAQAIWLSSKFRVPLETLATIIFYFCCHYLSPQDPLFALLGRIMVYLCNINYREEPHYREEPRLEEFQDLGCKMLMAAAKAQNISPDEFNNWIIQQRLNDPNYFFAELIRRLEAIVGNEWLFDRTVFTTPN